MPLTYLDIRLTIAQKLIVEWAGDAMHDFWLDKQEREDEGWGVVENPVTLTPRGALVAEHRGVLEDLQYRLLEQYPDVCEELEHCPRIANVRAAENAWGAIAKMAAAKGLVIGNAALSSRIQEAN